MGDGLLIIWCCFNRYVSSGEDLSERRPVRAPGSYVVAAANTIHYTSRVGVLLLPLPSDTFLTNRLYFCFASVSNQASTASFL